MGHEYVALFLEEGAFAAAAFRDEREISRASLPLSPAQDPQDAAKALAQQLGMDAACAAVAPGGLLKPVAPGTYEITPELAQEAAREAYGPHPYNALTPLCQALAKRLGATPLIHNPLSSDELLPLNRFSSMAQIKKQSRYYACEHAALLWQAARTRGKRPEELRAVVALVDDLVSVGAHDRGRYVDVNDVFGAEGPMGFTGSGDVPVAKLAALFAKEGRTVEAMRETLLHRSGVLGYINTDSPEKLDALADAGDAQALLAADALAYQTAKWIGSGALALEGRVDVILLSGKGARSVAVASRLERRVKRIAPVERIPSPDMAGYLGYVAAAAGSPACPIRAY